MQEKSPLKNRTKYITAQEAQAIYGINSKTLLNRSALSRRDSRYIPSVKLGQGRRKYFERKALDRLFVLA